MRGEIVIVRAFGGRALRRRVWDVGDSVVYVTNDEQFERLSQGKPAIDPIGFPKEDIFCQSASDCYEEHPEWSQLVPWIPGGESNSANYADKKSLEMVAEVRSN